MRISIGLLAALLFVSAAAANIDEAADYNARMGGVSMVVIKDGVVVFEDYPNAGSPDKAWELASGTKSFSGIIAAAAVQDGFLSLSEKAAGTLTEWKNDPQKSEITLRQVLSLTSGVKGTGAFRPSTYAKAIAQPMKTAPGAAFEYDPVNYQIFGEIMRRKLQHFENGKYETAVDYLQVRIFDPLDIHPAQWNTKSDGYPTLPSGADITAREWARFGQFVLQGGNWENIQLVDAAALSENFIGSNANAAYGLTWWLNKAPPPTTLQASRIMRRATDLFTNPRAKHLPDDLFMAAGAGGQRLYIIPSENLVVVRQYPRVFERRFGQRRRGGPFSDVEFLLALFDL